MVGGDSGRATPFLRRHRPSAIPNHQPRRNATYHSREAVQTTEASSLISIFVLTAIAFAIAALYFVLIQLILSWLWPFLRGITDGIAPFELGPVPIWLCVVIMVGTASWGFLACLPWPRNHYRIWRLLGFKRALRGYALMILVRLRQPRKDFFANAPLVSNVELISSAVVLHQILHPEFVAWVVPI